MEIDAIHELPADELDELFKQVNTNDKQDLSNLLNALANSIKRSLIIFFPDHRELIQDITDTHEAIYARSWADNFYPLGEGVEALQSIYYVISYFEDSHDFDNTATAIKNYARIASQYHNQKREKENEPFVKAGKKFNLQQKEKRTKRQTWHGLSKEQIEKRNQKIIDKFNNSKLSMNHFAEKYQNEFELKPSQIRTIIRNAKIK